ncbi:MAG: hypothetical protein LAN71_17800 [Acidobacteriia bacterium]|nr:hypothetical protein [Terriglobia bacterium]
MRTLSGPTFITDLDLYSYSTVKEHDLGQLAQTSDGRKFRYCKAVATTVTGDVYGSAGQDSQFQSMAVPAVLAIGSTAITVTNGTTAVAANDFDEGYLMVSSSTGIGQSSRILSHTTGVSGASITYTIEDPLKVALATTSKVTVVKNPYDDVIIQAVTPVAPAVGISQFAIPTGDFGWIQTGGPCAALWDVSVAAVDTLGVSPSTTTAGCVTVSTTGFMQIGFSMQVVPVSAYVGPVFLTID